MLVAILTDIHGNREALSACLAHARFLKAERLIFLGDYVGYGADPVWVVETVMELVADGAVALMGNHDAAVDGSGADMNSLARAAIEWTREQLDEEHRRFLSERPLTHEEGDTLYVHANPVDVYEAVTPSTPDEHVSKLLTGVEQRQIVTGHVHLQFEREVAAIRWIGAGSVGIPYEDELAAYWVLVEDGEIAYRRTDYEVERSNAAVLASGHPRATDFGAIRDGGRRWVRTAG